MCNIVQKHPAGPAGRASQKDRHTEDDMMVIIVVDGCMERFITRDFGSDLSKLRVTTSTAEAKKFTPIRASAMVKTLNELYVQQGRYPEILAMRL